MWILTAALVALNTGRWLLNFRYVYGWLMDDRYVFLKGLRTLASAAGAFEGYNALHAYFFLVSFLPLKLGISIPSHQLPLFGSQTGRFRFFLLYFVIVHVFIVLVWTWFAAGLARDWRAAYFSTVLFVASPTLALWTPEPDTRLIGLPLALAGAWLLLGKLPNDWRLHREDAGFTSKRLFFAAGSLWGIAQSLHYTSLYLIAPLGLIFWTRRWLSGWKQWRSCASETASFLAGTLWVLILFEALGHYWLHIPFSKGAFATLVQLSAEHRSAWPLAARIEMWAEWFKTQMGIPLLPLAAYGWLSFMRDRSPNRNYTRESLSTIGWSIALALAYLAFSGAQPMFRETSVIQPFLFLFAATGMVAVASPARREPFRTILAIAILGVALIVPLRQEEAVFRAHQGLGRALAWVDENRGDHTVYWFSIHWFADPSSVRTPQELESAPPGSWLISYAPWTFLTEHASLRPYLEQVQPAAQWATLYSTDTLDAELRARGYNDFRTDPLFAYVRVVRISDLLAAMQGRSLPVRAVSADSVDSTTNGPWKVFDHDRSTDGSTAWVSGVNKGPHTLTVTFASPQLLGDVQIAASPTDRSTNRISALELVGTFADGATSQIWQGSNLQSLPVIRARWTPCWLQGIRFVIKSQTEPYGPSLQARIEEVVFPGHNVIPAQ